jgi:hypothetical protein
MLASSSFNKVLSGVRECLELLIRGTKLEIRLQDQDGEELKEPSPLEVRICPSLLLQSCLRVLPDP